MDSTLTREKELGFMKRTSFARSPFSMNGRYRLQIVSFGAEQLLCEKELVMRVNQTTV